LRRAGFCLTDAPTDLTLAQGVLSAPSASTRKTPGISLFGRLNRKRAQRFAASHCFGIQGALCIRQRGWKPQSPWVTETGGAGRAPISFAKESALRQRRTSNPSPSHHRASFTLTIGQSKT